ncbi:MAG: hypothetical protein R8P61_20070 [Bacteroidia bacterium]|nr:hypothetical protein [Bacteroidia bacterium]
MKRKLFFYTFLLFPFLTFAQEAEPTYPAQLSLQLGYQNYRTLAKNTSPLIYVSHNLLLGFSLEKQKNRSLRNLQLSIGLGSNQAKGLGRREAVIYDPYDISGNRDSSVYDVNPLLSFAQLGFQFEQVWSISGQKPIYAGIKIEDRFSYAGMGADSWFYNQLSIGPSFQANLLNLDQSQLIARLSFPLLSFILNQPYTLDPSLPESSYFKAYLKTGSSLKTLNEFQQVNLLLSYRIDLLSGKQTGVNYQFMWMNDQQFPERNLRAYSNSISLFYQF